MEKGLCHLLEADVQVEGDGLSGIADRGDGVLQAGRRCTSKQLHCVGPRVVTHLGKEKSHMIAKRVRGRRGIQKIPTK